MNLSYLFGVLLFVVGLYMFIRREGFLPNSNVNASCPQGYEQTNSGDCRLSSDKHDGRL